MDMDSQRGGSVRGQRKRLRVDAAASAGAISGSDDDGRPAPTGPIGALPGAVAATASLSTSDTEGISRAIWEHNRADVVSRQSILRAFQDALNAVIVPNGPLASVIRCTVKEEVEAHAERQAKIETLGNKMTNKVSEAVIRVIKTTPRMRAVDDMSKGELSLAVYAAVGPKKIRELLPDVLNRRINAIAADATSPDDFLNIGFPAASKKRKTYSNDEFDKVEKSLVHRLYEKNGLTPVEERTTVLRRKKRLVVKDMDAVDNIILMIARQALHDGRSEARKQFFKLFAFFFFVEKATMRLSEPDAVASVLGAGCGSSYFAVTVA